MKLDIKNISATELNFDPSELTERFKRGDDSRSDGGSGLGLSIVQSFVLAQNGRFEISIDGDLFKATVTLPLN
jgi:signal transduction histidine kinase